MDKSIDVRQFMDLLKTYMVDDRQLETGTLTPEDRAAIQKLRDEKYSTWDWNFGASPKYEATVSEYVEGCGFIELSYNVKDGIIEDFKSQGDYFGAIDAEDLRSRLIGTAIRRDALEKTLEGVRMEKYYAGLTTAQFLDLLLK